MFIGGMTEVMHMETPTEKIIEERKPSFVLKECATPWSNPKDDE